jgi:hypothetical protein
MCFGKASGSVDDCPKAHFNVIAVRLLTIAVLQRILSPLLSVCYRMITPYVRPFWFKNDGGVATLRARYCDLSCAAMVTQFLFRLSARPGSVFRQLREIVRASYTRWFGNTSGLCVQPLPIAVAYAGVVAEPRASTSARRMAT